uniref:HSF-type DNA-binding domain-containing protein n=1 Tax=Panagrolaimus sp. JU765 TaxID=591449 RepID=A0AC34R350_9BILA
MSNSTSKQIMMIPGLDANTVKALPVFLVKLLKMLEDPELQHILCWDESGQSFHIIDSSTFSEEVLPQYFKHRNLNSFVRQLNFYGFRKLTSVDKTSLYYMENSVDDLHFMHSKFVRGLPQLMFEIKRQTNPTKKLTAAVVTDKQTVKADEGKLVSVPQEELYRMMSELTLLRRKTEELEYTVDHLTNRHETLWEEMRILREANGKQSDCFNKLIQFLISVMPANKRVARRQRPYVEADNMIVAPRHGGDVLSVIQQELHESVDISKRSVLEDEDNAAKNLNFGLFMPQVLNQAPVAPAPVLNQQPGRQLLSIKSMKPKNNKVVVPVKPLLNQQPGRQLLSIKSMKPKNNKVVVPVKPRVEYVQCPPSTSTYYQSRPVEQDMSPLMPDSALLDHIDQGIQDGSLMEYFSEEHPNDENVDELTGFFTGDPGWEREFMEQLSPNGAVLSTES